MVRFVPAMPISPPCIIRTKVTEARNDAAKEADPGAVTAIAGRAAKPFQHRHPSSVPAEREFQAFCLRAIRPEALGQKVLRKLRYVEQGVREGHERFQEYAGLAAGRGWPRLEHETQILGPKTPEYGDIWPDAEPRGKYSEKVF